MNIEKATQRIHALLIDYIGLSHNDGVIPDLDVDSTWEQLGADSLDVIEMLLEVEDDLGIQIPAEAVEQIVTPAKAIAYLVEHH